MTCNILFLTQLLLTQSIGVVFHKFEKIWTIYESFLDPIVSWCHFDTKNSFFHSNKLELLKCFNNELLLRKHFTVYKLLLVLPFFNIEILCTLFCIYQTEISVNSTHFVYFLKKYRKLGIWGWDLRLYSQVKWIYRLWGTASVTERRTFHYLRNFKNYQQKHPPEVFFKKKVFLEILQNSQENTSARNSF